jgi:hypothetical protein
MRPVRPCYVQETTNHSAHEAKAREKPLQVSAMQENLQQRIRHAKPQARVALK